jgi:hypothetical protein
MIGSITTVFKKEKKTSVHFKRVVKNENTEGIKYGAIFVETKIIINYLFSKLIVSLLYTNYTTCLRSVKL